ncbi:HAD-IA family hydrolase [Paraburkholderia sp.]|uniref:HAD-IA family hydrolase n=1 Tax=Paraburkholderia sp. TaxID=1926495 RepID=UPI00286EE6CA|nr:HAD-IA family hydrolase [Paraburkholderia sp.]
MLKHLFLDFDGVIHRSATQQLRAAFSHVVRENMDLPDSVVNQLFSSIQAMPYPAALRAMLKWLGIADIDYAISQVHNCAPIGWRDQPDAKGIDSSVISLIRKARCAGMSVDILSSAPRQSSRLKLSLNALADLEVGWIAVEGHSKADPQTYRLAVAAKDCREPARCALVDDSIVAIAAARAAGLIGYFSPSDSCSAELATGGQNWAIGEIECELFK